MSRAKERISYVIYKLKVQANHLDKAHVRLKAHHDDISRKQSKAMQLNDKVRATIYGNECAEIKKMCQTILDGVETLTSAISKLETWGTSVIEYGIDASKFIETLYECRRSLAGVVPEVSYMIVTIIDTLKDIYEI